MDYSVLIVCLLYTFGSNAIQEPEPYAKQDEWGGVCRTSKIQSPINICTCRAKKNGPTKLGPLKFDFKTDNFVPVMLTYKYEKLTLGFFYLRNNTPLLHTISLKGEYELYEIQIHFPAEHKIDGTQHDMELEFYYMESSYEYVGDAAKNNSAAGISLFINFASNANKLQFLNDVVNGSRKIIRHPGGIIGATLNDLSKIFPKDLSYYHYFGSHTHDCEEGYNWFILTNPITINQEQADGLMDFYEKDGTKLQNNARHTQPLNCRRVYYYQAIGP